MEKIIFLVILCAVVKAESDVPSPFQFSTKMACSHENDTVRNIIHQHAQCGEPKEVIRSLVKHASYEEVKPRAIWIKQCVGLCDFKNSRTECVPKEIEIIHIPVRIFNVKTNKESCAMYPMEEHKSCGCCAQSAEDCPSPWVYVPQMCTCQCPNTTASRACTKKTNMRWNYLNCSCELKTSVQINADTETVNES